MNALASIAALAGSIPADAAPVPFADVNDVDLLGTMTAQTVAMAETLAKAETAVTGHGKAYGQRRAVLQMLRNVSGDSLNAADKAAIGFDKLPGTAKPKRQLSKWHSDFGFIAERWTRPATATDEFISLNDEQRNGILLGNISFLTVADKLRGDIRKAKADADKAAKAKADADAVAALATEGDKPAVSLSDAIMALADKWMESTAEERLAAGDAMALFVETVNATGWNISEETDVQEEAPEAEQEAIAA